MPVRVTVSAILNEKLWGAETCESNEEVIELVKEDTHAFLEEAEWKVTRTRPKKPKPKPTMPSGKVCELRYCEGTGDGKHRTWSGGKTVPDCWYIYLYEDGGFKIGLPLTGVNGKYLTKRRNPEQNWKDKLFIVTSARQFLNQHHGSADDWEIRFKCDDTQG